MEWRGARRPLPPTPDPSEHSLYQTANGRSQSTNFLSPLAPPGFIHSCVVQGGDNLLPRFTKNPFFPGVGVILKISDSEREQSSMSSWAWAVLPPCGRSGEWQVPAAGALPWVCFSTFFLKETCLNCLKPFPRPVPAPKQHHSYSFNTIDTLCICLCTVCLSMTLHIKIIKFSPSPSQFLTLGADRDHAENAQSQ